MKRARDRTVKESVFANRFCAKEVCVFFDAKVAACIHLARATAVDFDVFEVYMTAAEWAGRGLGKS